MEGVEQVDRVFFVDLNAVIGLFNTACDPYKLYALQELFGEIQHCQMVAVEIWLTLGAVDNELVDLPDAAADLERRREHRTAHADDAGLADARQDRVGILQLLFRQRLKIFAGCILIVVFDHDGHDHIAERMRPRLDSDDLAGDGGVNRCGNRRGIFADLLPHLHIIADGDKRLIGRTDMLRHGDDHLRRRRDHRDRDLRGLHVIGVYAALECMGHIRFTSHFCTRIS